MDREFYVMAPIHKPENSSAYVLASEVLAEELPYLGAMNFAAQCPIPNDLKEGDSAFYEQDYMQWYNWRIRAGFDWKEKAKAEWWFGFLSYTMPKQGNK